jgi:spermidine/putrescine transport system ATP-binding protein
VTTSSDVDVRLDRVTKRFGEFTAVDDLSLEIEHGEFFSMLGPSGCGKTTTLRMIGGFEEVTAGTIYLGDADVTDLPPFKRDTNTVFQNYALFPHLNVYENIAFGLRRRKVPPNEIRHQVAFMLKLVELPGYEARKPSQLSGGQQQRVALARALINHPRVLLLDEPLGALDLKLRKQMQVELKRIQSEIGITFIFVTHDQEEAMTMSDRIAVMRHGHIEQLGTPEELYERPKTEFVAGFLGVSNLLDAEVAGRSADWADLRLADGTMVRAPGGEVNGARHVRIGVRPEKLRVVAIGDGATTVPVAAGETNAIEGVVLDASYIGVSTQYLVETADGHKLTVYAQNLETSGAGEAHPDGQRVRLTWKPQHTFVIGAREAAVHEVMPGEEEEVAANV